MNGLFLADIHLIAVVVSALVYFFIGSLWYSPALFSSVWVDELKNHHVVITAPTSKTLVTKMLLSFVSNFATALAMAHLVALTDSTTCMSGLKLGILAAVGFAAPTLASVFIWESRSLKLFLIDIGYPVVGIIASAVLLSVWH